MFKLLILNNFLFRLLTAGLLLGAMCGHASAQTAVPSSATVTYNLFRNSIMLGTIVLICEAFFQTMRVISNGSRYSSRSDKGGGVAVLVLLLLALVRHDPGVAGHVGDGVIARDEFALGQLLVEHVPC